MLLETRFLVSIFVTLIIEVPVLILFSKFIFKIKKVSFKKLIIVGLLASALTLPYLWFVLPFFINTIYYIYIGELLVFLIEAAIYYGLLEIKLTRVLIISFVANLVSFIVGLIVFY